MCPKSTVLLPLYIYPAPGAWDPLKDVPLPDANYTREIPKLATCDNVLLLGYVATGYATRDLFRVRNEVETYAAWPNKSSNPSLAVRGIFFDETPQDYNANALAYLRDLTNMVKQNKSLGPDNFVVHNPGTTPDPRYLQIADSAVVFEATYDTFIERNTAKVLRSINDGDRTQLYVIIHSVPDNIQNSQLRDFVKEVRQFAEGVFITHLNSDYYASFDTCWAEFVGLVAAS